MSEIATKTGTEVETGTEELDREWGTRDKHNAKSGVKFLEISALPVASGFCVKQMSSYIAVREYIHLEGTVYICLQCTVGGAVNVYAQKVILKFAGICSD